MRFETFPIKISRNDFSVLLVKILNEFDPKIRIEAQDQGDSGRRYELYYGKKLFFQIDAPSGGEGNLIIDMRQIRLGQAVPNPATAIWLGLREAGLNIPRFPTTSQLIYMAGKMESLKVIIPNKEIPKKHVRLYPPELLRAAPSRLVQMPDGRPDKRWTNAIYELEYGCPVDTLELEDQLSPPLPVVEGLTETVQSELPPFSDQAQEETPTPVTEQVAPTQEIKKTKKARVGAKGLEVKKPDLLNHYREALKIKTDSISWDEAYKKVGGSYDKDDHKKAARRDKQLQERHGTEGTK